LFTTCSKKKKEKKYCIIVSIAYTKSNCRRRVLILWKKKIWFILLDFGNVEKTNGWTQNLINLLDKAKEIKESIINKFIETEGKNCLLLKF
jgi:phosphoribosylformimino-5-aminoimidazole carboxamide ribonucleotide (ProFAR) isomerase